MYFLYNRFICNSLKTKAFTYHKTQTVTCEKMKWNTTTTKKTRQKEIYDILNFPLREKSRLTFIASDFVSLSYYGCFISIYINIIISHRKLMLLISAYLFVLYFVTLHLDLDVISIFPNPGISKLFVRECLCPSRLKQNWFTGLVDLSVQNIDKGLENDSLGFLFSFLLWTFTNTWQIIFCVTCNADIVSWKKIVLFTEISFFSRSYLSLHT